MASVRVIHGDMREQLRVLRDDGVRVHSIVTDPPYGLEFMGKDWDTFKPGFKQPQIGEADGSKFRQNRGTPSYTEAGNPTCKNCGGDKYRNGARKCRCEAPAFGNPSGVQMRAFQRFCTEWAELAFDLLPPGGHLLCFGGTRTFHRLACAIEDAGFELRDTIMYLYGSGFPKAHNLKNKPEIFCQCEGNALPNGHDKQTAEHGLRPLREANLSAADNIGDQRGEVLFPSLPQSRAPQHGASRSQSEPSAGEQSGVDWRQVRGAREGLRDDPAAEPSEGKAERLRVGTHPGRGGDARPTSDRNGGGPSQRPQSGEQRSEQSEDLREPSGTLDGRALPHGGCCPRCGKLTEAFKGFSTALKPAAELICVARKPLIGTVAANVLAHGTGALNIDGCRVATADDLNGGAYAASGIERDDGWGMQRAGAGEYQQPLGRWPANVVHDGSAEVVKAFPESASTPRTPSENHHTGRVTTFQRGSETSPYFDEGSAARFFYSSKADSDDRLGSKHPTVKPVDLMRWLVRLVTPPGGTVLDPFAGSGTTGMACMAEGFDCILIEREAEYVADIKARIAHVRGDDTPLFAVAAE